MKHRATIGIGANEGDAIEHVLAALDELSALGRLTRSSLYRTPPWGKLDQPSFVNAAAILETDDTPRALLETLQGIELRLGRTRGERWGPRTIDLDILTYDNERVDEPDLVIPHPRMRERAFVLVPLSEIDASFAPWRDALDPTELAGIERIEI